MSCVFAQDVAGDEALSSYSWEAVKVVFSLLIVLGVFYLLVSVFKKYSGINVKANSAIRVVGGLSLGGKDKVVILQTRETNLLLGVSNAGITKLHEFADDQLELTEENMVKPSAFSQQIEKLINKN